MPTYALILDANNVGTGCHVYGDDNAPLAPGEVICNQEQAKNPSAWIFTNGILSESLPAAQAAQNALNYASYLAAIQGPVSYTSKGGVTAQYQADPGSVTNLQSTILGFQLAQATPAGFYWVALDNSQVPFEYADLLGLAQAMALQGAAAFAKRQSLKAQVA
ncbi:MAG: DUF4376 domain-containing protein, partial [Acidithiobacillus ferriphilus]